MKETYKMKKLMIAAAIVCAAALSQAATVGWGWGGACTASKNSAYDFFVIGQKGVTSVAQITALVAAGSDVSGYAFGTGVANANGIASVTPANSGKTIDISEAGTIEAFFVLFDNADVEDATKYLAITKEQSSAGLSKPVTTSTASLNFAAGNQATYINTASNWQAISVPEPTSGLLLLLGVAGLALRRRRA